MGDGVIPYSAYVDAIKAVAPIHYDFVEAILQYALERGVSYREFEELADVAYRDKE